MRAMDRMFRAKKIKSLLGEKNTCFIKLRNAQKGCRCAREVVERREGRRKWENEDKPKERRRYAMAKWRNGESQLNTFRVG